MRDNRRRFLDFITVDFRKEIFEYRPQVIALRLVRPHGNSAEPLLRAYYPEKAIDKLTWIAECYEKLKQPVRVFCLPKSRRVVYGFIFMIMENFPVADFAKRFKLPRVLDRGVERMSAFIASSSYLEITDDSVFRLLSNPRSGYLTVGVIEGEKVVADEVIVLPIELKGQIPIFN